MATGPELSGRLNAAGSTHSTGVLPTARRVAVKELRMAVRDRQTVIYTVWLPLLLYPALFWLMIQGLTVIRGRNETTAVRVEIVHAPELAAEAERAETALHRLPEDSAEGLARGPVECATRAQAITPEGAALRLLEEDAPDALLVLATGKSSLYYDSTESQGQLARRRASERLGLLRETLRTEAIDASGEHASAFVPFELEVCNLASERELSAYFFSFILPMTFVLMAVMGSFYPAVDCIAGEKERGTVESTLLLAAPRLGIQLGKILAVTVGALVATLLNLLGLVVAAEPLLASMNSDLAIEVPWSTLALALPLCGAFLFTTSAIMVALASFTETFKQGQSLLGVVQMAFIVPAVFAVMPSVQLDLANAWVPVVQTVLAFKALLTASDPGTHALELGIVFLSQGVYAVLAILLSVRLSSLEALQTNGASLKRALSLWTAGSTPR